MKKLLLISILGILLIGSLAYAGITLSKDVSVDKELITTDKFSFEKKDYNDGTYDIRVYVDTQLYNHRTGESILKKALVGYKYRTTEPDKAYSEIVNGYLYRQKQLRETPARELINQEKGDIILKETKLSPIGKEETLE